MVAAPPMDGPLGCAETSKDVVFDVEQREPSVTPSTPLVLAEVPMDPPSVVELLGTKAAPMVKHPERLESVEAPHPVSNNIVKEQQKEGSEAKVPQPSETPQTTEENNCSNNNPPTTQIDEVTSIMLEKMEQLNKMNEADTRSVTAVSVSGGSNGSPSARRAQSMDMTNGSDCPGGAQGVDNGADFDADLDLWTVWGDLVKNWNHDERNGAKREKTKDLVRRGIPSHFRTIAWQLLSGAEIGPALHELYADYLRQSSPYEKTIQRDIPRTFPELAMFKDGGQGQQSLFNVIKAYSLHDKEVGYCQGSGFIAGQLLLQMPEEEAFAVLLRLMEHYRLRELYKPMMTELGLCMFQLECLVQEQMPDLHMHFVNMGFDTSMYASGWFLTLFLTSLPLELANRIMDLFLVEGMDAVFKIAMAILQQSRIDLLQLDMEGMVKYLQREVREKYVDDHELLFHCASRVHLNAKRMKRLEKDYLAKRTKEQEEAIELRRLRTENRLLRQRIDYLEHESQALADRLVQRQIAAAQSADTCLNISHELGILRDINSDAHRRLEEAYDMIRELTNSSQREREARINDAGVQVDDTAMIMHIHELQQELIEAHSQKADIECTLRDQRMRMMELESANKRLRECPPDGGIAELQEELVRVKMREAEAALSLKEMRQRLAEIDQQWTRFMQLRGIQNPSALLPPVSTENGCCVSPVSNGYHNQPQSPGSEGPTSPRLSSVTVEQNNHHHQNGAAVERTLSSVSSNSHSNNNVEPAPQLTSPTSPPTSPLPEESSTTVNSPTAATMTSAAAGGVVAARQKIARITASLMGPLVGHSNGTHSSTPSTPDSLEGLTQRELEDRYMGLRIREADTLAELHEMHQRVMELETQNHVAMNQLKRQDEEMRRVRAEKDDICKGRSELFQTVKDREQRLVELESELKERSVMQRLKYSEALNTVAELRQQIAQLESKNAEKMARAQIRGGSIFDAGDTDSLASSTVGSLCSPGPSGSNSRGQSTGLPPEDPVNNNTNKGNEDGEDGGEAGDEGDVEADTETDGEQHRKPAVPLNNSHHNPVPFSAQPRKQPPTITTEPFTASSEAKKPVPIVSKAAYSGGGDRGGDAPSDSGLASGEYE